MKDVFMVIYLKTNILAKIEFVIKLYVSFQAYLENIQAKTGKSPEDLGHGHCVAIWALFKGKSA